MLVTLIDRMGEWNPQLFRELKGRLKPTHIVGNWQWFWVPLGHIPILAYGWTISD